MASKQTVELLRTLVADESLPIDAIEGLVMVLDDVATLAGTATERKRSHQTSVPVFKHLCILLIEKPEHEIHWLNADVSRLNYCSN
jgi:hypothetical protein